MYRHTTNRSRVITDHMVPSRYELWNTTMNETQPDDNTTSYRRDLLSHAVGVAGHVPSQYKEVGRGYVHQNSTHTTTETVELGDEPVDRALQLVTSVDSGTTCELCLDSRETAMQLITNFVDDLSVMTEVFVEVYYSDNAGDFQQAVVTPVDRSASVMHSAKTFKSQYTTAAESDSIDGDEFFDRFQTWYHNLTGTTLTRAEVIPVLKKAFEDVETNTVVSQQGKHQQREIHRRRWVDELQSN